ncbi:hypothetical protein FDENT_2802 [Fusarium denticulatum]|uniref:Uncharacterized protein n=1 Tax=Fusarium denticulatum TaxID=48507 RepID=A0A8H6CUH9_9HYPO|nr:hypothetical protein FDENT_2802 [Fusarium denticulatum]
MQEVNAPRDVGHYHMVEFQASPVLAPEMVCLESLQEFLQARKAVRRCAATTNNEFKTVHGFYLCMMGVRYNSGNNGGYRTLWSGHWGLSREEIADKNKADGLVKRATLLQIVWFTVQCITRSAHHLPLATIDTMTLAYVFNGLVTYAFWWEKPKDIVTVSFVNLPDMTPLQWEQFESLAMESTYDVSDPSQKQDDSIAWYVVPRDCRDDKVGVMEDLERDTEKSVSTTEPKTRKVEPTVTEVEADNVITEWDSSLYMTRYWPLLWLLGASFGAIHLTSWTSSFPSEAERWL